MFTRKPIYFYAFIIFLLVSVFSISGFAVQASVVGNDINLPEVPLELVVEQPPRESMSEIVENGYQRVYSTTTVPVAVEQLEEMRQYGKTLDIDPKTGAMIIQSFKDYLPENWLFEKSASDELTDSYGNPIVNQTPGLPDWAQRDVNALRSEIENSIEQYWNANASELRELEWVLGNFISQAIVRKIEFRDIVELTNQDVVSDRVADSIMEYLHFYENLKYSRSLAGKFTYSVSEYNDSIEGFVKSHGKTLKSVIMLADPDEGSRGAVPSGCYTKSTFGTGLSVLTSPTVICDGSVAVYDDYSADVPIGFDYVFYGCEDYDVNGSVRVSTNGYISFYQQGGGAEDGIDPTNFPITDTTDPDGYIAAWWDDMVVYDNGITDKISYATEGSAGSREFTVDYYSISTLSQDIDNYHYYQIKLFEADGSVEFHYGVWVPASNDDATIGMENYTGTDGDCGPNCGNLNNERPPNNYRFVPRYNIWSGNIDTAWDNVNNWEPNQLPTNTISVIIPDLANDVFVNSSGATCSTLNVQSGAVVSIADLDEVAINVYGNIINNGTIQSDGTSSLDIYIENDCTISGGGSWSNLDFVINSGTTNLATFLETGYFNLASGAVFNTGNNTITTLDTINYGTINAGSTHWYIGRNYMGTGIFNAGKSEVDFHGSFYSNVYGSPTFYILDVNKTGLVATHLKTDVDVSHHVFTHGGNLFLDGYILTSDNCDIYGDNLINNDGTFILTGNGPYFHSGSNYTCSAGVINSAGNIWFQDGSTEDITGGTIYLEGNFTATGGNFTPTGGTVVFDGSGTSYIYGSPDFFDMSVAKDSGSITRGDSDFTVTNSLKLVSGTFYPNGYTVTIGE